ncbi:hypothetical protein I4U23_026858 [Adineta vaga]|nr:hypothetical protein I4U23_026858 [Adineta vaga]
MDYSLSQLQEMTVYQQEQIKHNQQLLISREQRLKYLKQQEHFRTKQRETKQLRLKTLHYQLNQQRNSNSTFENELEIFKQIFLNKEEELKQSIHKVEELTKQLEQIKRLKFTTAKEQSQNKNDLDKLKQELLIRNKLNEQQNRQIAYQREIYKTKQMELTQLDSRIEELQQQVQLKKSSHVQSNRFQTGLDHVQMTLNNINIAEIEKRMVQLANSFSLINTNDNDQSDRSKKDISSLIPPETSLASTNEITTLDTTCSSSIPIVLNESSIDGIESSLLKSDEQILPANLRLNDDILSVHFNHITSNVKKRHSLSDPCDSLTKYLPSNIEQQPIQVHNDLSSINPSILNYENLFDFQAEGGEEQQQQQETISESVISNTESEGSLTDEIESTISFPMTLSTSETNLKSLLKTPATPKNTSRRVIFDPLALLLDAAVIGELDLVTKSAKEVKNPSQPNDEGLTALHNAICAGNIECVKFLIEFGCDINYPDNDGWTPLHCAASCNHITIVEILIENGACIYATTIRDNETPADKCEEDEENYSSCSEYLLRIENDLGVINDGIVYALYDYQPSEEKTDELEFNNGDQLKILRREDEQEYQWWWAKHEKTQKEGYVPRNYLGLYPRVRTESSFAYARFRRGSRGDFRVSPSLMVQQKLQKNDDDNDNDDHGPVQQQSTTPSHTHNELTNLKIFKQIFLNKAIQKIEEQQQQQQKTISESVILNTKSEGSLMDDIDSTVSFPMTLSTSETNLKSLLKTSTTPKNTSRRVIFDPLALLFDTAVIGELDLIRKSAKEVKNANEPNDEGLTALHNAICAGNIDCIKFLIEFGCDIHYPDNDGWTPLHCAASCNHTTIVKLLIENGACIYATTIRDNETPADKLVNNAIVYTLYDYQPSDETADELEFDEGDQLKILRRGDKQEYHWW